MTWTKLWKILFHKDTLLLLASLFLFWGTITSYIMESTSFNALQIHTGIISKTEIRFKKLVDKPLFKDTTLEMKIYLNEETDYYTVTSKNFNFLDSLFIEDSVNIYTNAPVLGIFGSDKRSVWHLERIPDKRIFISYYSGQKSRKGFYILTGIATISFFLWYMHRIRRRIYWGL